MKGLIPLAIVMFVATAARGESAQCAGTTGRTVAVTGTSTLRVQPDRVSFSVGVDTDAQTVSEAVKRNSTKVKAIQTILAAHGVEPEEIRTSDFSITSRDWRGKKLRTISVSNMITITRNDAASAGDLLQACIDAGANQSEALRFFIGDPKQFQDQGIDLAYADARAKASKLATLSGLSLGQVICASEDNPCMSPTTFAVAAPMEVPSARAAAPISTGVQKLRYAIKVVFELKAET